MLTPIAHTGRSFDPAVLKGISLPTGLADPADTIEMMGASMHFKRNAEICGENEPADYLYKVASGAVRTYIYKVLTDGRRQIGAFYLQGDVFGLESGDLHAFSAEAISNAKILVVKLPRPDNRNRIADHVTS